jgi:glycosyltransferase involved in cell wall biosynthesis
VDVRVVGLRDDFTDADQAKWGALRPKVASVRGPVGFGYAPRLEGLLDENVDLAYAATLWKYPSWAVLNWQKKTRKPVVVAPHGSLDAWALKNSKWKKRIASLLFKTKQLKQATCFRALCQAEADAIRAYGLKQRIEVVPNGVELPEGLTKEDTGSREGKKRLLFLGRIHPKKGLVGLLKAWAEIQKPISGIKNSRDWQLVIAGWDQGGHEGELKALCAKLDIKFADAKDIGADVIFMGPAFGEEKEALLRSAEAFILPSFSEGLPMSVLEAWAYGLPVVMTPECNLPEGFVSQAALEIRNAKMGNEKWDGLRALIEMTDQERAVMGMRGRRLVEERFTWPKIAAQMKALYKDVLNGA